MNGGAASGWEVGDLALCVSVRDRFWPSAAKYLRVGGVYRVTRVGLGVSQIDPNGTRRPALGFRDIAPWRYGFPACLFIKVTPPADMVEEERRAPVIEGLPEELAA